MKEIKEINNCFINETNQNELLRNKTKIFCSTLNYIKQLQILLFVVMAYISMSTFASLVDISKGIMCYTVGLNI